MCGIFGGKDIFSGKFPVGNFGGMFPMGNFQMKKKKKKDTEKHSMVVTESIQYSEYTVHRTDQRLQLKGNGKLNAMSFERRFCGQSQHRRGKSRIISCWRRGFYWADQYLFHIYFHCQGNSSLPMGFLRFFAQGQGGGMTKPGGLGIQTTTCQMLLPRRHIIFRLGDAVDPDWYWWQLLGTIVLATSAGDSL